MGQYAVTICHRATGAEDELEPKTNSGKTNEGKAGAHMSDGGHHPYVSESHEGSPWFEWMLTLIVAVATVLGFIGKTMEATAVFAVASMVCAFIRLVLRERSPWKVRSVRFDSFIGFALGLGLIVLYMSIRLHG